MLIFLPGGVERKMETILTDKKTQAAEMTEEESSRTYWNGFGKRLQRIRKAQGFTAEKLARHLGMSPTFIRQIECGAKRPSVATLVTFARELHVSADELLDSQGSGALLVRRAE